MNNRSKIALLSSLTNLTWFILAVLWQRPRVAGLAGESLAQAWGVFFLVLTLGFSVFNVLGTILVMALEKRRGGEGFEKRVDERDRHIQVRVMRLFGLVFSLGFLTACALLALGQGLSAFFKALAVTFFLSALTYWLASLAGYERGI